MGKAPAFQFYAADFISDSHVVMMSLEERGAYITLLCHCWIEGGIPNDIGKLARLCGVDGVAMASLWRALSGRFRPRDGDPIGTLCNPRMEEVRQKQIMYRVMQSEYGVKGAKERWRKKKGNNRVRHSNPNGESMAKEDEDRRLKTEEEVQEEKGVQGEKRGVKSKRPVSGDDCPAFVAGWGVYPKGRGTCIEGWREWQKLEAAGTAPTESEFVGGIEAWKLSRRWKDGFVVDFERFVKRRMWENPETPAKGVGSGNRQKPSGRYFAGAEQDRHIYDEIDRELGLGAYAGNPKPADVP